MLDRKNTSEVLDVGIGGPVVGRPLLTRQRLEFNVQRLKRGIDFSGVM